MRRYFCYEIYSYLELDTRIFPSFSAYARHKLFWLLLCTVSLQLFPIWFSSSLSGANVERHLYEVLLNESSDKRGAPLLSSNGTTLPIGPFALLNVSSTMILQVYRLRLRLKPLKYLPVSVHSKLSSQTSLDSTTGTRRQCERNTLVH